MARKKHKIVPPAVHSNPTKGSAHAAPHSDHAAPNPHAKHSGKVSDPFHHGKTVTRRQLKLLQARHDKRIQGRKDQSKQTAAQAEADRNDPTKVTQPLTPNTLDAEVTARTASEFGPQEQDYARQQRAYGQQIAGSDQQQARISDWYEQYKRALGDIQSKQAQDYQTQVGTIQNMAASGAAVDQQQQGAQNAVQQAGAGGSQVDPSLAANAAQGSLARQALVNSFGAQLAQQGTIGRDYLRGVEAAGQKQGIEQHVREAGHRDAISQKSTDLAGQQAGVAKQKGDFAVKTRGDLRDKERQYQLELQAFGLNVQKEENAKQEATDKTNASIHNAELSAAQANKKLKLEAKKLRQAGKISQRAYELEIKKLDRQTRNDQVGQRISQQNANTSSRNADNTARNSQETARHNQASEQTARRNAATSERSASKTASGAPTPSAKRSAQSQFARAQAIGRANHAHGQAGGQKLVDFILTKVSGIPPALASIAARQAAGLPIGPGLVRIARAYGIRISQTRAKPKGKKAIPGAGPAT